MMPIEDIKHEIEKCKQHIARIEGWIAEPCMSSSIAKNDKALARELTLLGNLESQLSAVREHISKLDVDEELMAPDWSDLLVRPADPRMAECIGGSLDGAWHTWGDCPDGYVSCIDIKSDLCTFVCKCNL